MLYLLELAYQCQHYKNIELGRAALMKLPRTWLLACIEEIAKPLLDLSDEWEFLWLLEVYRSLDKTLVERTAHYGLTSQNVDIRETSQEFLDKLAMGHVNLFG